MEIDSVLEVCGFRGLEDVCLGARDLGFMVHGLRRFGIGDFGVWVWVFWLGLAVWGCGLEGVGVRG